MYFQLITRVCWFSTFKIWQRKNSMMAHNIVSFVLISNMIRTSASSIGRTHLHMVHTKVIPDVIPVAPRKYLYVGYPSRVKVDLGNELAPRQVKDEPILKWIKHSDQFYTLCMIDADFPSAFQPSLRAWQHWLVGNIPGDQIDEGDTLSQYIGAFPLKGSGLHRYVFLVYKQPRKLNFNEPRLNNKSLVGRAKFNITKFAEKYQLGIPDAGNFFTAEWDDYVPEFYESLDKGHGLEDVN